MNNFMRMLALSMLAIGQMAFVAAYGQSTPATAFVDDTLNQVLAAVAKEPLTAAPFLERRLSPLFAKSLESRGTLTYKPPGHLEKLTTSPIREKLTITGDTITIESGSSAPKLIKLDAQKNLAAYAHGVRALLSGDSKPLQQYFDVKLSGTVAHWELKLSPTDEAIRRALRNIVISGDKGQIRVIETTELNGDSNELTILAR